MAENEEDIEMEHINLLDLPPLQPNDAEGPRIRLNGGPRATPSPRPNEAQEAENRDRPRTPIRRRTGPSMCWYIFFMFSGAIAAVMLVVVVGVSFSSPGLAPNVTSNVSSNVMSNVASNLSNAFPNISSNVMSNLSANAKQ